MNCKLCTIILLCLSTLTMRAATPGDIHDETVENYLRFAPAVALVAMKAAGVESKSSWKEMLVADAFSVAIMCGAVKGSKMAISEQRPDGSDDDSFPSGHTACAFMTATMLTKEYGHLSPWIGVGAYATATATGVLRVAHKRHNVGDVVVGAGIGVTSTMLGYWIKGLIFKHHKNRSQNLQVWADYGSSFSHGMSMTLMYHM